MEQPTAESALAAREKFRLRALAHGAWKRFLEATPPNVSATIEDLASLQFAGNPNSWCVRTPEVELHCEFDGGIRFFTPDQALISLGNERVWNFLGYACKNCGRHHKVIALVIDRASGAGSSTVEAMKLGEFPPFAAPLSHRVQKLLEGHDLDLYRKGMRSEAQGLGIGAATYFRRIVENQWKEFVKEIRDAAEALGEKDLTAFDAALKEKQFSQAVQMLKSAIPGKLLILDGQNPLTLLHQPLSVGLHGLTDADCLQQAADIRTVLTALLENIADVLNDRAELKAAAARLTRPKP